MAQGNDLLQGYGYEDVLSRCSWILNRMMEAAGENSGRLWKALSKARKNLPDVLIYLKRAGEALKAYTWEQGYSPEAFVLMYKMPGYPSNSPEYQAADRRIRHLLKGDYGKCYLKIQEILIYLPVEESMKSAGRCRRGKAVSSKLFYIYPCIMLHCIIGTVV